MRGVAIAVLLAMFIGLVVYMLTHDWYFIKQKNAVSEYDTVTATLDRYWENEDYYDFFNYSDSINISGWSDGPYLDYHPQIEAAQIYIFVNNYISEYLAADNIFYKNKALTDICGLLDEFYDLDNLHKMNVICPSCGAEFNKNLSQCPYCGNSNYYGQEKSYMKGLAGLRQRLAELADINKKIIVEEAVKVLVLVLAVVIILVAAIFSVKAIDRHNESIAVNNIRKEIIDGR